jgi:hypothetical protein
LLKDLAKKEFYDTYTDAKIMYSILEGKFVFSLIWSFGASADTLNRKKIEAEIKQVLSGNAKIDNYDKKKVSYPERNTLFDYNFAPKKSVAPGSSFEWVLWTDYIDVNEKISKNIIPQEIIVKTNDSVRYSQVLKIFIEN